MLRAELARVRGRRLYAEDGRFEMGNLQDWQHSAMYAAFLLSGVVDLLGRGILKDTLPRGTEHVSHLVLPSQSSENDDAALTWPDLSEFAADFKSCATPG